MPGGAAPQRGRSSRAFAVSRALCRRSASSSALSIVERPSIPTRSPYRSQRAVGRNRAARDARSVHAAASPRAQLPDVVHRGRHRMSVTLGLFVKLEAAEGKADELEAFLKSA